MRVRLLRGWRAWIGATALGASLCAVRTSSAASADSPFRLPWSAGQSQYLTQDANDDCCGDHVGANKFAYDFALPSGGAFDVASPAEGTLVHVKMSSNSGCADASCVSDANYIVIDHGDGTQTTMLHLAPGSLDPQLTCGSFVRRGQRLATTGSTGWSTGVHLHVERDQIKRNLSKTCECGANGMACAPNAVEWSLFWPSSSQPNLPIAFDEWSAAPSGSDRRGLIGPSRNVDDSGEVSYIELDRFSAIGGDWNEASGGRRGAFRWSKAQIDAGGTWTLKGAVPAPGLYEVWAFVPLSSVTMQHGTELSFEAQADDGKGATKGTLAQDAVGGAYHRVRGLERVRLTGAPGESIAVTASTPDDGRVVAVDGLVLRRTIDDSMMTMKLLTPNAAPSAGQLGLALAAKGGGRVVSPEPAPPHSSRTILLLGAAVGVAMVVARERKKR